MELCISKKQIDSSFESGFLSVLAEKRAQWHAFAPYVRDATRLLGSAAEGIKNTWGGFKDLVGASAALATMGAGTGVIGALGYDVVKDQLTQEDPEVKIRNDIKELYEAKDNEVLDSKWMDRVRGMRDDLLRNFKKMTVDEYRSKYKALVDALDERKD